MEDHEWTESEIQKMTFLLRYLNSLDEYTFAVIVTILKERPNKITEMGRMFGVSRQAMHRKLRDIWKTHAELKPFMAVVLPLARIYDEPPPRKKWRPAPKASHTTTKHKQAAAGSR